MRIIAPTRLVLMLQVIIGTGIGCLSWIPLLFFTSLGDSWADWEKLWVPLTIWGVAIAFFLSHRSPEKKDIDFRIM